MNCAAAWRTSVPVDTHALASQLRRGRERTSLHGDWDGLLVRRPPGASHYPGERKPAGQQSSIHDRSHELGHLTIALRSSGPSRSAIPESPTGSTTRSSGRSRPGCKLLCGGASRVPLSWVESRLPSATDSLAAWLVSLAAEARVSIIVAMISAVRAFPPGILFVLTDADGSTTYVGLSPDSDVADARARRPLRRRRVCASRNVIHGRGVRRGIEAGTRLRLFLGGRVVRAARRGPAAHSSTAS